MEVPGKKKRICLHQKMIQEVSGLPEGIKEGTEYIISLPNTQID
jgi:hypothetical protein